MVFPCDPPETRSLQSPGKDSGEEGGNWKPRTPVVGMQSGVVATEAPPEVKNRSYDSAILFLGTYPEKSVGISKRYLHSRAHCCTSHKNQDAKTTKVSVLG